MKFEISNTNQVRLTIGQSGGDAKVIDLTRCDHWDADDRHRLMEKIKGFVSLMLSVHQGRLTIGYWPFVLYSGLDPEVIFQEEVGYLLKDGVLYRANVRVNAEGKQSFVMGRTVLPDSCERDRLAHRKYFEWIPYLPIIMAAHEGKGPQVIVNFYVDAETKQWLQTAMLPLFDLPAAESAEKSHAIIQQIAENRTANRMIAAEVTKAERQIRKENPATTQTPKGESGVFVFHGDFTLTNAYDLAGNPYLDTIKSMVGREVKIFWVRPDGTWNPNNPNNHFLVLEPRHTSFVLTARTHPDKFRVVVGHFPDQKEGKKAKGSRK